LNKIERGEQRLKKHHINNHHHLQQQEHHQRKILDSQSTNTLTCNIQNTSLLANMIDEKPNLNVLNQHLNQQSQHQQQLLSNDTLLLSWSNMNTTKNENIKQYIKTEVCEF
jgi:hypothetical protein